MESTLSTIKRAGKIVLVGHGKIRDARPREVWWTKAGAVAGLIPGFIFGGVGIAALGTAFGLPWFVIGPLIGAVVGNRIGLERDRATPKASRK